LEVTEHYVFEGPPAFGFRFAGPKWNKCTYLVLLQRTSSFGNTFSAKGVKNVCYITKVMKYLVLLLLFEHKALA
jgi:hypothetical protein